MTAQPIYKEHWGIELSGNTSLVDRGNSKFGRYRHFIFWEESDDYNDTYSGKTILSSYHVDVLGEEDARRAMKRMEVLLMLLNGIEVTLGRGTRTNNMGLIYQYKDNGMIKPHYSSRTIREDTDVDSNKYSDDDDFNIFMEELNNPFDPIVTQAIREKSPDIFETVEGFMVEMATENDLSRNILIWRALCEEDNIHFITNAYKIYETVRYFANRNRSDNPFIHILDCQMEITSKHTNFMNGFKFSGLLSRHGYNNNEPSKNANPKSSWINLRNDINDLVLAWFKYWTVVKTNQAQNIKKVFDQTNKIHEEVEKIFEKALSEYNKKNFDL